VTFVHLPFSVRSLDFFCRFTRVHEGLFMFCYKEEFQVELSLKKVLWQIFISHRSAWFPLLLSACRLAEFDTVVIPHVFMHCSGSFLLQDMLLNHHEFAFEGQYMKYAMNMLLACLLYRSPSSAAITNVCNFSRSEPYHG